nr:MAG TPA: hypothetical protein [Caudoviricetes sp.]DAJ58844.1 MAG TPA: hypothetical protein [Caudoviricetes sp.]
MYVAELILRSKIYGSLATSTWALTIADNQSEIRSPSSPRT